MNKQEQEALVQNQLTIMNDCFQCLQLNELCGECLEAKDVRDAIIAYHMAEYGAVTEPLPELSILQDEPSGHDWISGEVVTSVDTKTNAKTIRAEFFEQSSWLIDRLFDLDDSMTLTEHECVCSVCHYTINKHAKCPNCDERGE